MATLSEIRRFALALPGAIETDYGGARFAVGKRAFVHYWAKENSYLFKLPHAHQELLFEVRPEIFSPFRSGAMLWSWVKVSSLKPTEAKQFVLEAWTTVVAKKAAREFLANSRYLPAEQLARIQL